MVVRNGHPRLSQYWQMDFSGAEADPGRDNALVDEFGALLTDATHVRLRADVPVGVYLSGGIDSSTVAALAAKRYRSRLETFSIAFSDPEYDESVFQSRQAVQLGSTHHVIRASHADIGTVFPEVIWHTEAPILRTGPAPMFLLSKLVQKAGFKVVLSGDGADEFLGGYDIFKETAIRRFWARQPDSIRRPLLLGRLYPDMGGLSSTGFRFLSAFFRQGLTDTHLPGYSHAIRWHTTSRAKRFFSAELRRAIDPARNCIDDIPYPLGFSNWGSLEQAQFLEAQIFLPQYLLSSQGDRMAMAHSVEARYPFLDHRLVEFCNRLPAGLKLRSLAEKHVLRTFARELLPESIWSRRKRPYRAPIHRSFFDGLTPDYVGEMLSPKRIRGAGLFNPGSVAQMVEKVRRGGALRETDDMALAGILSSQLIHHLFVSCFRAADPLGANDDVKIAGSNSDIERKMYALQ